MAINQSIGNFVDKLGTGLRLPELGISEAIAGKNYTTYSGITPQSVQAGVPSPYQSQNIGIAMNPATTKYYQPSPSYTGNAVQTSSQPNVLGSSDVRQTSGGGGGGGARAITEQEALGLGLDWNNLPGGYTRNVPAGPSPEELQRQLQADVDNVYSEAMGIYNNMMPTDAQKAQYEQEAMNPYNEQLPLLEQSKSASMRVNQQQKDEAAAQYESALAAARRLFQELTQGVQQRFGGSNSAGEFAQNFYGREYQNQRGQQQNTHGQNVRDLGNKAQEIETGYQANLQKINMEKETAKLQARRLFQDKIDQINSMKGQLAQNKAALKLQALQELRNRSYQIEDSVRSFAQQIEAQRQAALTNIQQMQAQYQINQGQPVNIASMPSWTAQKIGGGQTTASPGVTGYWANDLPANRKYDYNQGVYTG